MHARDARQTGRQTDRPRQQICGNGGDRVCLHEGVGRAGGAAMTAGCVSLSFQSAPAHDSWRQRRREKLIGSSSFGPCWLQKGDRPHAPRANSDGGPGASARAIFVCAGAHAGPATHGFVA